MFPKLRPRAITAERRTLFSRRAGAAERNISARGSRRSAREGGRGQRDRRRRGSDWVENVERRSPGWRPGRRLSIYVAYWARLAWSVYGGCTGSMAAMVLISRGQRGRGQGRRTGAAPGASQMARRGPGSACWAPGLLDLLGSAGSWESWPAAQGGPPTSTRVLRYPPTQSS